MKFIIKIFVILTFIANLANARTVHLVEFFASTPQERSLIGQYTHLDGMQGDIVYSLTSDYDLQQLKKHIPFLIGNVSSYNFDDPTPMAINKADEFPEGDELYHTYAELMELFKKLAQEHPNIAEYFSLGQTIQGREIIALKITLKENKENKPGILFTGSHHAREHLSTEVPLLIAKHIVENYESNDHIKKLVNEREIYFAPMINPDGAMWDINNRYYQVWRKSMRAQGNWIYGVDLNRNYAEGWGGPGSSDQQSSQIYRGPKPFSEPETRAVKEFVENHPNLKILLSFHSFSELILYPWGNTETPIGGKIQEIYEKMGADMAKWNGYRPMQSSKLYVASGDTCDWAWAVHEIFCFTFELSPKFQWGPGGFYPGAEAIMPGFRANLNPALYLIEHSKDPYAVIN